MMSLGQLSVVSNGIAINITHNSQVMNYDENEQV
jgi:hypothetical protein